MGPEYSSKVELASFHSTSKCYMGRVSTHLSRLSFQINSHKPGMEWHLALLYTCSYTRINELNNTWHADVLSSSSSIQCTIVSCIHKQNTHFQMWFSRGIHGGHQHGPKRWRLRLTKLVSVRLWPACAWTSPHGSGGQLPSSLENPPTKPSWKVAFLCQCCRILTTASRQTIMVAFFSDYGKSYFQDIGSHSQGIAWITVTNKST